MDQKENFDLNFKLPEIHFSDDENDDDTSSLGGSNIQIFSRPTLGNDNNSDLDLSFLDHDSSSQDWLTASDAAALGSLDDDVLEFPEPARDVAAASAPRKSDFSGETRWHSGSTTKVTSSGTQCDSDSSTLPKRFASTGTSTLTNASIASSGQTPTKTATLDRNANNWAPLKLGDVADVELSKVLDQLKLPNVPDATVDSWMVPSEPATDSERHEELMRQLSQHSLLFSAQPSSSSSLTSQAVNPAFGQSSTKANRGSAISSATTKSSAIATADSLTERVLQAMESVAKRPTVCVDLRHSQAANLQMSDLLRFGPSDTTAEGANGDNRDASSSEDEGEAASGGGLWLDSYRRAKNSGWPAKPGDSKVAAQKVAATAGGSASQTTAGMQSVPKENGLQQQTAGGELSSLSVTADLPAKNAAAEQTLSPASELEKKLEAMRQREAELSRRRSLLQSLRDLSPSLLAVGLEPVAHDDISFTEPPAEPLDPSGRDSDDLLLLEARLSPCGQLLGPDGRPLDVADTYRDATYHCLLAWLISLSGPRPKPHDPLHVLGLRQLADWHSVGNIRLQVAACANRQVTLHRFLADCSLAKACSAWLKLESADFFISRHPLAALLGVSRSMDGKAIGADRVSLFWHPLRREPSGLAEHWPPCSLPMEASVLELDRDLVAGEPNLMLRLLRATTAAGCDISGIRLVYPTAAVPKPTVALAVRGCGAVAAMRNIGGVFEGRRDGWAVSRFVESVPRDLSRYFGGRVSPKITASQLRALAPDREEAGLTARLLTAAPLEDMALLASPLITEIGWVLHLASESGFALIGCRRVQLHKEELASQLGMAESQAACFSNGVGCVLLLRRENALHHAGAFIQTAVREIKSRRQLGAPASLLFFAVPYLVTVLQTVHCTRIESLPKLKTDAHRVEDCRFADQEQLAALLISGRNFQAIAAQLLDQFADLELLGLKCLSRLPQLHSHFVAELLLGEGGGGGAEWRAAKPLMEQPALVFVIRGVGLMQRLAELMPHYPTCGDYRVLHTGSWHQAYSLTRNFFADFELFECPDRRACLLTCPPAVSATESSAEIAAQTVLSQLRHPGPDRIASRSILLLSGAGNSHDDDQHWLLRAVARVARLVARDSFDLDWLGLVEPQQSKEEEGGQRAVEGIHCVMRLRRENAVAALASRRSALVEALPSRMIARVPASWRQMIDVEQMLSLDRVIGANDELFSSQQPPSAVAVSNRYSVNASPSASTTAASDCVGVLWRLPEEPLPLLARLCDLLHRRGVQLIGLRSLRLDNVSPGRCASVGRDLRLRRLLDSADDRRDRSQLEAVLTNKDELLPGTYLVFVLEGNLVSLGLPNYLTESVPPDSTGLLSHLGHPPVVYQTEGATAGAVHLANRLSLSLLPSNLIVCLDNAA